MPDTSAALLVRRDQLQLARLLTQRGVPLVEYVAAFDSIVRPDYLVLAVETNLIRAASKPCVYAALVAMSNAAAGERRASGSTTKLMVSVQVDVA